MSEAERDCPQPNVGSEQKLHFSRRLFTYCAVWLLAVVAFQVFLSPEGLVETDLSPLRQRLSWPFYTPLMSAVGLAQAVTWPVFPQPAIVLLSILCLVAHAIVALTRTRLKTFVALAFLQILLLTVAVVFYVRQSVLPSGG